MTKISHGKVPGDSADAFKQIYGGKRTAAPLKKGSRKPVAKKKTRKSIAVKR